MNTPAEHSKGQPGEDNHHYDLVTRESDYPAWDGPPKRSYLICTHPRSGSTLLGEALFFAGGMGCPLEYFHRGFRPYLADRWVAQEINSYLEAVLRHRTDPSGSFSVKLFWSDIEDICRERDPALFAELDGLPASALRPDTYRKVQRMLAEMFPNPVFIHLSRLDRVRQAVSSLVAMQTKRFRSIPGAGPEPPPCEVQYDYQQILRSLAFSDNSRENWLNFFRVTGVLVQEVVYEKLVQHYTATLQSLFRGLDLEAKIREPRMRRQADDRSEQLVRRFLWEYARQQGAAGIAGTATAPKGGA